VSTLTRYWLLQIPSCLLLSLVLGVTYEWFDLPAWMALLIFALWVAKDAILYPFLKPGYESSSTFGAQRLVGMVGVAKQNLDPEGYVFVHGEWWKAIADPATEPIRAGEDIRVQSAAGMQLTVSRAD
jgi:membrane-bound serine protease (ClpP class)